ncbi:MAG: pseudouridine synthase [Planctomycetes bacterium]|nr:pseudouridine synthase [Planctomycetota bacterium]
MPKRAARNKKPHARKSGGKSVPTKGPGVGGHGKKVAPKKRAPKKRAARKGARKRGAEPKGARQGEADQKEQRLQKVLAGAGVGSRRQCEELILTGRVEVDGKVVTQLGTRVDPSQARIRVDGAVLARPRRVYYALNKPSGVVCTARDPSGRPLATALVPARDQRLFTVGRLDMNSEGLILLTNDGELANQLTHPRYGVGKTYRVLVAGHLTAETAARLRRGIHLAEGPAQVVDAKIQRRYKQSTILEMVLEEGRNREVRRVLARVGHKVLRLVRVAIGPLRLGKLASGEYRRVTRAEVDALRHAAHAVKHP